MPDHDGIEVLEFARQHQRDAVRVLLTGYLDERAQQRAADARRALQGRQAVARRDRGRRPPRPRAARPGAPAVRIGRGRAQPDHVRRRARRDRQPDGARRGDRAPRAHRRRRDRCATVVRSDSGEHPFTGGAVPKDGAGWYLDLPLDVDGDLRLRARGVGESARQLVTLHGASRAASVRRARGARVVGAEPRRARRAREPSHAPGDARRADLVAAPRSRVDDADACRSRSARSRSLGASTIPGLGEAVARRQRRRRRSRPAVRADAQVHPRRRGRRSSRSRSLASSSARSARRRLRARARQARAPARFRLSRSLVAEPLFLQVLAT